MTAEPARKVTKVLIADRGEAALRVLRACRELGLPSVVVYSELDRDSLPVLLADEAVCIGPGPAQDSYLNVSRVLSAAEIAHCDAIHPGCGQLADSPEFADAVLSSGLCYIGPSPETMYRMRDKVRGRELARNAGLPVLPGSDAEVADVAAAAGVCAELGYPVMVKSAVGVGPKNKRVVRRERDLETGFRMAQADARAEFGDGRVYIEKLVPNARHIEVPVIADVLGNIAALPERDCSVQLRFRKLLEESPSPSVTPELRVELRAWSVALARAAGLTGVAVVEFVCDEKGRCGFIEADCRLHAEHTVTEMVTGLDVVRLQLRGAAGEQLVIAEPDRFSGHALECRISAEDTDAGFEPSYGLVTELRLPGGPGIRVDTYLTAGYVVPQFYDTLLAKVVAWAPDRSQAIARMERALSETVLAGPASTLGLHRRLMQSSRFRRGRLAVGMLDEEL